MRRVCSWCGKSLDEAEGEDQRDEVITHGLCADCAHHLEAMSGMPLQRYLDGMNLPIIVVDANVTAMGANKQACALLQKDLLTIEKRLGGEVFECERSYLPEGCGRTVHCSGCTIRRAATETHATGRSKLRVPVTLTQRTAAGTRQLSMLLSTQKVGEMVFLRIDSVAAK